MAEKEVKKIDKVKEVEKKVDSKKVESKKDETVKVEGKKGDKKVEGKKGEGKVVKVIVKKQKKAKRIVEKARVYVISTFNNSKITITDLDGNVLSWSSCGTVGFKGTKKSTAYAATKAAEDALQKAQKYGVREASVYVKGIGQGRQAAVKGLKAAGLNITMLSDMTPVPHGGVKPKKPRKV